MSEKPYACCFTGHRPHKLPWGYDETDPRCAALKRRIRDAAEAAWNSGCGHFICGMALGCDLYFCEAVLDLRAHHPAARLEAAVPCPEQADRWTMEQKRRYRELLELCDVQTVVSQHYSPWCMQRRDRYMVDRSTLLIAAFDGTPGGTRYTVEYALKKHVSVLDLPVL